MTIINVGSAANDGNGDPLRDAFRKLNASSSVISRTASVPASPANGDLYIVPTSPTGAWTGQANNLAWYNGTSWEFYTPVEGLRFWVNDSDQLWYWSGSVWQIFSFNSSVEAVLPQYFRAVRTAAYNAVNSVLTTIPFDTLSQNTILSGFNTSTGVFTVPSSLDGKIMVFEGGLRNAGTDGTVYVSFNGSTIAQSHGEAFRATITSGAIRVSTGDTIAIQYFVPGTNAFDLTATFFTGYVISGNIIGTQISQQVASFSVTNTMLSGNRYIEANSSSAVIVTVPPSLVGTEPMVVEARGTGTVTFAAGAGVTIDSLGGRLSISGRYGVATLLPKGANRYVLFGALS